MTDEEFLRTLGVSSEDSPDRRDDREYPVGQVTNGGIEVRYPAGRRINWGDWDNEW